MIRVEPTVTNSIQFKSGNPDKSVEPSKKENNGKMLGLSLAGLAAAGAAAIGLKKTSKMSYEEALKKNGVQIKDGIATLIESGKKFTGKIERFETRNRKETVEFVDGKIKEKIYHNLFGRELDGYFYKDGVLKLRVGGHSGNKHKSFAFNEFNGKSHTKGDMWSAEIDSVFDWAREYLKNMK